MTILQEMAAEMHEAAQLLASFRIFTCSREKAKQPEGTDLFDQQIERLRRLAMALDALAAQEPVSKVIVCPVCYSKEVASDFLDGETSCGDCCAVWNERKRVAQSIVSEMQNELDFLRAEVEVLRKQLHLANIDACNAEAELNSAAPPPAAPVSMAELEKALDDALGEAWRRGATGCHPAGEMVLRAHVLRLASAGVVATVSREAFVAAYSELFNNDDPSALRALGIEVME